MKDLSKQPDLFGCVVPSATEPEKAPVLSTEPHDFPMSAAYEPRGIGNVPGWLRDWWDEDEWSIE